MQLNEILSINNFFDFEKNYFEHSELFLNHNIKNVLDVLDALPNYCSNWFKTTAIKKFDEYTELNHVSLNLKHFGNFKIITGKNTVFEPDRIIGSSEYNTIFINDESKIFGGTFDVSSGNIYIGKNCNVHGAWLCGSSIIGNSTTIRPYAYLRGNVIIGDNVVIHDDGIF